MTNGYCLMKFKCGVELILQTLYSVSRMPKAKKTPPKGLKEQIPD